MCLSLWTLFWFETFSLFLLVRVFDSKTVCACVKFVALPSKLGRFVTERECYNSITNDLACFRCPGCTIKAWQHSWLSLSVVSCFRYHLLPSVNNKKHISNVKLKTLNWKQNVVNKACDLWKSVSKCFAFNVCNNSLTSDASWVMWGLNYVISIILTLDKNSK